jgi:hypothetical protein
MHHAPNVYRSGWFGPVTGFALGRTVAGGCIDTGLTVRANSNSICQMSPPAAEDARIE